MWWLEFFSIWLLLSIVCGSLFGAFLARRACSTCGYSIAELEQLARRFE